MTTDFWHLMRDYLNGEPPPPPPPRPGRLHRPLADGDHDDDELAERWDAEHQPAATAAEGKQ